MLAAPAHWTARTIATPLGDAYLTASDLGLCGMWFVTEQRDCPDVNACARESAKQKHPVLQAAADQLTRYFDGNLQRFDLPLDLHHGTAFQQSVWLALLAVPFGHTSTYGALATQVGKPKAARAVGAAVGSNPISIIVPCHRIVGQNGDLTGFGGGMPRKVALLQLEGVLVI